MMSRPSLVSAFPIAAMLALAPLPVVAAPPQLDLPVPSPTATRAPQGPVIDGVAPPRGTVTPPSPRPTQPPTPAATPTPSGTPTPSLQFPVGPTAGTRPERGTVQQPASRSTPAPDRGAAPAGAVPPSGEAGSAPDGEARAESETAVGAGIDSGFDRPQLPRPIATPDPTEAEADEADGVFGWWWAILLALLAASGAAAFAWQRFRQRGGGTLGAAPQIERPQPRQPNTPLARETGSGDAPAAPAPAAPAPAMPAAAAATSAPPEPLELAIEARRMSLSLMNASCAYRVALRNSGTATIRDLIIGGDLVSAHASLPPDAQRADAARPLPELHRIATLEPGESFELTGELRLPLSSVVPIRREAAAFFVPLARWRVTAGEGLKAAVIRTLIVGMRPQTNGGLLQPFRIDLGPRSYSEIAQRSFA